MKSDRRVFVIQSSLGVAVAACAPLVFAMAGPVTDEKDPKAVALGYRADAAKVDTAKFPNYVAGQSCKACQSFQGSPGIAAGPCPKMPKPVLAAGWCSGFVLKG